MTTLIIGAGLVGAQVARILAERGERPPALDARPPREVPATLPGPVPYKHPHLPHTLPRL